MTLPASHIHVSERENAHRWPDGRYDNAAWEDCAWDVAVELVRALGRVNLPATHREAEALRAASGEDTWSGSSHADVRRAISRRYGMLLNPTIFGFDLLWRALKMGTVASVAGSMGAFRYGHPLRRHDASFNGTHQVLVFRLDNSDRVWWCDPLAPTGYRGEWVTKVQLYLFVRAGGNLGHFVGRVVPGPSSLDKAIATVRLYIARLTAVKTKTAAQVAQLALYKKRLAEYLSRK